MAAALVDTPTLTPQRHAHSVSGAVTVPLDVVELLQSEHHRARALAMLAQRLATAPTSASTAMLAATVAEFFERAFEHHLVDEERSLVPRLVGRHAVVDLALGTLEREHLALRALTSQLSFLCRLVARDVTRLFAVGFELLRAADALAALLARHHEREESIVFTALRRLLDVDDIVALTHEVVDRRAARVAHSA